MGKSGTNVMTYIGLLFLFALLVAGLTTMGRETILSPNSNLDNDSISYIGNLSGIDIEEYKRTQAQQEDPILVSGNGSVGNSKDDSLDFLFAKEKGFDLELTIKRIFGLPTFILIDLLRLPVNQWQWVLDIIGWLLFLTVTITIIYFVRNR